MFKSNAHFTQNLLQNIFCAREIVKCYYTKNSTCTTVNDFTLYTRDASLRILLLINNYYIYGSID